MISRIETGGPNALRAGVHTAQTVGESGGKVNNTGRRSIGEVPPEIVNPAQYPHLLPLIAQDGIVSVIFRKLKLLTRRNAKKDRIVLAKNTIAAADPNGAIYLGVDFLEEEGDNSAVLAGVLAHEWGHLLSDAASQNYEGYSWDQLFEKRRQEEGGADAACGKLLPLMGYSVEPVVEFLLRGEDKLGSHKYYEPKVRAEIIRKAAQTTIERQKLAREVFNKKGYLSPYHSPLLIA